MAASRLLIRPNDMIFTILDRFATEDAVNIMLLSILISPLSHRVKHITLNLNVMVADGRVVKCAEDVVDYFVNRHICVLPGV